MFRKIFKFETRDIKAAVLWAAFVLALFAILLFLEIRNYSNTMASFKENFQEKELSLLDIYNKEDRPLFKPEQFRFRTCLIPTSYSHFLNGNYPATYANVGVDPLFTFSDVGSSLMNSDGLGFNTIIFYLCLCVFVYGLRLNSSMDNISKTVGLTGKNVKKKMFLFLFAIRVPIITIIFLLFVTVYVVIGAFFEIKILGPLLIAYLIVAVLAAILSFSIGAMFSFAKSFLEIVIPLCLLIFIFFIPLLSTDNIGENNTDHIFKKMIEEFDANYTFFEKTLEAGDKFKNKKVDPGQLEKFINVFLETYYKKIDQIESRKIEDIKKNTRYNWFRDSFSPLSFYSYSCSELITGKSNLISLYQKAKSLKKAYLTWNLKRRILGNNNVNEGLKPEPFLKKGCDDNFLYAVPSLPVGFFTGIFTTIFYILIIVFIGYWYFLKNWLRCNQLGKE